MHESAYSFVASLAEKTRTSDHTAKQGLDVGGRNVNGTVRNLWRPDEVIWTVIDLQEGNDVTVVADFVTWDCPTSFYDLVVCTEVLEHCNHWQHMLRKAVNALAIHGHLIITCAGPGRGRHGADGNDLQEGEHYENVSAQELATVLLGCPGLLWRTLTFNPYDRDLYFYGVKGWEP